MSTGAARASRVLSAFERYDIVPDMVVLGNVLGGGVFPMAALVVREGLDIAADRANRLRARALKRLRAIDEGDLDNAMGIVPEAIWGSAGG